MIHIHARRPDGAPSYEVEDFRAITEAITAEVDVVVNYSTGAIGVPVERRVAYLRALKPAVAALNMGSMNYAKYSRSRRDFVFAMVFANPFDEIVALLEAMNELGIKPEHECFDLGPRRIARAARPQGRAAAAAARLVRAGRARRRAADRAQPRGDGRQHPGGQPLGADRDLARAVGADRRGARARRLGPRRARGQLLPAGRRRWPAPTATSWRARGAMAEDAGRRVATVEEARGLLGLVGVSAPARRRPRARPLPAAAGRLLLAAARGLRRGRAQGRGHRAGRLHPLGAAALRGRGAERPRRRCSSRSTAASDPSGST